MLSCHHSRADLHAALTDATLNQYGDPYTLIGLERAIRRQLAGGCGRETRATTVLARGGAGGSIGDQALALGAGLFLVTLGAGGWAARRALTGKG